MKKTSTLYFLPPPCYTCQLLLCLLLGLGLSSSFGQSKSYTIPGVDDTHLHIQENSTYREISRANLVGKYNLKVKLTVNRIEGNTHYRGFYVANNQFPSYLSCDIQAYSIKGVFFKKSQVRIQQSQNHSYKYEVSFSGHGSVKSVALNNVKAYFSSNRHSFNYKRLIDQYYTSAKKLQNYLQALPYLDFNDPDRLTNTQHKLHDMYHDFDKIKNYHFDTQLHLAKQDPANLQKKIQRMLYMLNKAEQKFHKAEQQWAQLYYKKFLTTHHSKYLDLAIEKDKNYAPPYLEKASIALKSNRPDDAVYQLKCLHNYAATTSSLVSNAISGLYQNIFDYYVDWGNRQSYYQGKIKYYKKAGNLCQQRSAHIYNCQGKVQALITGARTQHYQSHLNKFNNLLHQANYQNAYQSLLKAARFQQEFGQQIPNHHAVLYQKLYNQVIQKAQSQVTTHNYEQALQKIQFAETIAQRQHNVLATQAYQTVKTAAHSGIFDQQFQQTQLAVNQGNFTNAAKLLQQAQQYYQQNQRYMQNAPQKSQQLNQQYQLLMGEVVKRGQLANRQRQHNEGLRHFKLAQRLLENIKHNLQNASAFVQDIQLGLATSYVGLGVANNAAKQYRQSLQQLALAENMLALVHNPAETATLQKDIAFYKKEAIQQLIQEDINKAQATLKADNLQAAMQLSQEIQGFTRKYNYSLTQDATLNQRYEKLKQAIFDKECELNQKAYNQLIQQARSTFDQQKFIEGWGLLEQAIAKAHANMACGIASQMAEQLKTRYKNAHQYALDWKKLRKLAALGSQSRYKQAIKLHHKVARNYAQYNLKIFGIQQPDLKTYFSNTANASFWAYGIVYFLKKKDQVFANTLMNKYMRRVAHKQGIRGLATQMANVDFILDDQPLIKNRCKDFLSIYAFDSSRNLRRRVRWFKKAYCRRWNRLRKNKS